MIYIYPDFYFDFECKAGKCEHTCCKDWEIDVDEDSVCRFSALPESEAAAVLSNIGEEDSSHFILREDGRCPFLESDGLCSLIKKYGEDFVPYICREHPRFYNEYNTYCECGLGLSCEKAVSLLLNEDYLDFIFNDDNEDEPDSDEELFINRKYDIIDDIAESEDILNPLRLIFGSEKTIKTDILFKAFSDIEALADTWGTMLADLRSGIISPVIPVSADKSLKAFAQYLAFRHYVDTSDKNGTALFIACSTVMCSLLINKGYAPGDVLREFSSEIEYSDENIERIINALQS